MIMNKKGFTLFELLAIIVIIGVISGIATISYRSIINASADRVYTSYEDTMHAEAAYMLTNRYNEVNFINNKARLSLNDLKIEPINNPNTKSDRCTGSYVDVTRTRTSSNSVLSITYKVCLICQDYNSTGTNCRTYEN